MLRVLNHTKDTKELALKWKLIKSWYRPLTGQIVQPRLSVVVVTASLPGRGPWERGYCDLRGYKGQCSGSSLCKRSSTSCFTTQGPDNLPGPISISFFVCFFFSSQFFSENIFVQAQRTRSKNKNYKDLMKTKNKQSFCDRLHIKLLSRDRSKVNRSVPVHFCRKT